VEKKMKGKSATLQNKGSKDLIPPAHPLITVDSRIMINMKNKYKICGEAVFLDFDIRNEKKVASNK
jgi:hypothetical protein